MAAFSSLVPPSMNPATTAAMAWMDQYRHEAIMVASGCAHATNCNSGTGNANPEMHTHECPVDGTVETIVVPSLPQLTTPQTVTCVVVHPVSAELLRRLVAEENRVALLLAVELRHMRETTR
jgi:hypothetical protein